MDTYTKNQTIIKAGEPFTSFALIAEGSVSAAFDSAEACKPFVLKKGDVIGIFEFGFKEYSFNYTALEDVKLIPYSLPNLASLPELLNAEPKASFTLTME